MHCFPIAFIPWPLVSAGDAAEYQGKASAEGLQGSLRKITASRVQAEKNTVMKPFAIQAETTSSALNIVYHLYSTS